MMWLLLFVLVKLAEGNPCPIVESLTITDGLQHENGSISYNGLIYPSGSWYEDELDNVSVILGCPCIGRICMFKCCPDEQEYVGSDCVSSNTSAPFSPPLFKEQQPSALKAHESFFYLHGRTCDDSFLADTAIVELYIQEVGLD